MSMWKKIKKLFKFCNKRKKISKLKRLAKFFRKASFIAKKHALVDSSHSLVKPLKIKNPQKQDEMEKIDFSLNGNHFENGNGRSKKKNKINLDVDLHIKNKVKLMGYPNKQLFVVITETKLKEKIENIKKFEPCCNIDNSILKFYKKRFSLFSKYDEGFQIINALQISFLFLRH